MRTEGVGEVASALALGFFDTFMKGLPNLGPWGDPINFLLTCHLLTHIRFIFQQGGAWFEAEMGVKQDFPKLLKTLSGGKITIKNHADLMNRWWALDISIWLYQALSLKDVSTDAIMVPSVPLTRSSLLL